MKAEDFRDVVVDTAWSLGVTSIYDVFAMISFVTELAKHSTDASLYEKLCQFIDEVDSISEDDLVAVGCDDDWWE